MLLNMIAGFGMFCYGLSYEDFKLAVPNLYLRMIFSIGIWIIFFILIKITGEGE
jgi:hypothetical protein